MNIYVKVILSVFATLFCIINLFCVTLMTIILCKKQFKSNFIHKLNFIIFLNSIFLILQGIFVIFASLKDPTYGGIWICKILVFLGNFFVYVMTFTLSLISIYRFIAVAKPLSFQKAKKNLNLLIIIIFFVSMLFTLPCPFLFSIYYINDTKVLKKIKFNFYIN